MTAHSSSSSAPSWLATTACSPPPSASLPDRLAFLLLSPCPQRALLGALDLLFLLAALALSLHARLSCHARQDQQDEEPLLAKPAPAAARPRGRGFRHNLALGESSALAAASLVLLALTFLLLPAGGEGEGGGAWAAVQRAFLAAQLLAHLAAAGTIAAEKAAATRAHPPHLRVFWFRTALLVALFFGSAAARFVAGEPVLPDDPIAFAGLVLSLPLLYFAIDGSSGLGESAAATSEEQRGDSSDHAAEAATSYATASWLSLATFSWINPLITKGYRAALGAEEVPPMAPSDTAEAAYALFVSNWPNTIMRTGTVG